MIFDETGERLTPTHVVKKGARYRYYVSASLIAGAARANRSSRRIPAADLERVVIDRLRTFFGDPGAVLDALAAAARGDDPHARSAPSEVGGPPPNHAQMITHARQLADNLGFGASDRIRTILMALRCRVKVAAERINIRLSRRALSQLLSDPSASISLNAAEATSDDTVVLTAPARLARVGRGVRLYRHDATPETRHEALQRAPPHPTSQNNPARSVQTSHAARVLAKINPNDNGCPSARSSLKPTGILTDLGERGGPSHNQTNADWGILKPIQSVRIPL